MQFNLWLFNINFQLMQYLQPTPKLAGEWVRESVSVPVCKPTCDSLLSSSFNLICYCQGQCNWQKPIDYFLLLLLCIRQVAVELRTLVLISLMFKLWDPAWLPGTVWLPLTGLQSLIWPVAIGCDLACNLACSTKGIPLHSKRKISPPAWWGKNCVQVHPLDAYTSHQRICSTNKQCQAQVDDNIASIIVCECTRDLA